MLLAKTDSLQVCEGNQENILITDPADLEKNMIGYFFHIDTIYTALVAQALLALS